MHEGIRSVWRFFYFITSTIIHIAEFALLVLFGKSKIAAATILRRRWLSHVPAAMGIRVRLDGTPYKGTCLYASNHIGYLDPIVVLMHVNASIVAKSEISKWPLIGLGGYIIGTIYVNRNEKSSRLEAATSVRKALENGISILVFPEGTTSAGPGTLPFRPRSFEAASLAGVPVQPVALSYDQPEVAYIEDHTFLPHFFRLFRLKTITARVVFGPPLEGPDTCAKARQWIDDIQLPLSLNPV